MTGRHDHILNVTNNNTFLSGTIQIGETQYNIEDFLKDIKISVVDMSTQIKEIKDRLSALENRFKVDQAQMNEKWNQHQRKIAKLERNMTTLLKTPLPNPNAGKNSSIKKSETNKSNKGKEESAQENTE